MWQDKAHRIIYQLCLREYERANRLPNGRLRKRHVPYVVPEDATFLIDCLDRDDEHAAKAHFIRLAYR